MSIQFMDQLIGGTVERSNYEESVWPWSATNHLEVSLVRSNPENEC